MIGQILFTAGLVVALLIGFAYFRDLGDISIRHGVDSYTLDMTLRRLGGKLTAGSLCNFCWDGYTYS